jgi:serine protease Do
MNSSLRRLLALVVVFVTAFIAVSALRTWRAGGDPWSFVPGYSKKSELSRPEKGTFPENSPLNLSDVELLSRMNNEYARLTEVVVPSVVSIDTAGVRSELLGGWGGTRVRNYPTQGQGSGVIVTKEGHVITNHHVIAGQQTIRVTLHNGKTFGAQLIGEDTLLDIAVLKIDANETFTPLKLGDSSQVKVGQIVMAVGNPFGLGETVTQGIISAKERSLSDNQRDLFQTDAAINPGNSGGPLVNVLGEIIGINVAIFSPDKQNPGFQGVGFSIPSNDVKDTLTQILERGRPIRGFLGINQVRDVDERVRTVLQYGGPGGSAVLGVLPGSPAEIAGLQYGDIVESVGNEKIKTSAQLIALVQRAKVGATLELNIWRKGESMKLKAVIAESGTPGASSKAAPSSSQGRTRDAGQVLQALGIQVRDLTTPERMQGIRGVIVTSVTQQGLAANQIKAGDLIIAVNKARINGASEFSLHLAASAAVQITELLLVRDGALINVNLPALPRNP